MSSEVESVREGKRGALLQQALGFALGEGGSGGYHRFLDTALIRGWQGGASRSRMAKIIQGSSGTPAGRASDSILGRTGANMRFSCRVADPLPNRLEFTLILGSEDHVQVRIMAALGEGDGATPWTREEIGRKQYRK